MKSESQCKLIGVITAGAEHSEQKQLLSGIIKRAGELNIDVAVFSNIYNAAKYHSHVEIENNIYNLMASKRLDGIIVNSESIVNEKLLDKIVKNLTTRTDIPVISTGRAIDKYTSIDNNTMKDIMNITNHLIEVHGFTDIHMLTGYDFFEDSHNRVNGYKEALLSHNIQFDENKVIFGNFWLNSGEDLAMEYITEKRKLPQAIVCANDYMAYGLCDVFLENNIFIPDDVTVIGYEYVGERYYHAPVLTTYYRNRKALGIKAVNTLYEMMGGPKSDDISLDGHMIFGNSCSCCPDNKLLFKELSEIRSEMFYSNLNLVSNFEQQLSLCRSLPDYVNVLQQFSYMIRDAVGIYLCLYENWCNSDFLENSSDQTNNESMICYTVISPKAHSFEPKYYDKYQLFPNVIPKTKNENALYFCPIFFSGRELGYIILQYDKPDGYDSVFRDWLKTASTALEFLRMKNDIHTLLEYNNLSSLHDSVTGMYNEHGLKNELHYMIKEMDSSEKILLVLIQTEIFADDDSIKRQHISVQISLEIAGTLKKATEQKNKFCGRLSNKLYAYAAVSSEDSLDRELICDKLTTLIRHGSEYSKNCDMDSIAVQGEVFDMQSFDFDSAVNSVTQSIMKKINTISSKRDNTYYMNYLKLRNRLYINPNEEWNSQEICRDMHMSYGYFRATYKELFGVSFHQDVIQSKISYAKYLLITTMLSLPAIAEKCGYEDYKYFLRQFKNFTGITPNAYRKDKIL